MMSNDVIQKRRQPVLLNTIRDSQDEVSPVSSKCRVQDVTAFARSLFFVLGNYLCGSHVDLVYIVYMSLYESICWDDLRLTVSCTISSLHSWNARYCFGLYWIITFCWYSLADQGVLNAADVAGILHGGGDSSAFLRAERVVSDGSGVSDVTKSETYNAIWAIICSPAHCMMACTWTLADRHGNDGLADWLTQEVLWTRLVSDMSLEISAAAPYCECLEGHSGHSSTATTPRLRRSLTADDGRFGEDSLEFWNSSRSLR